MENKRICPVCGREFEIKKGRGRPQIYCSNSCCTTANQIGFYATKQKVELPVNQAKICEECGKEFKARSYNQAFCSRECQRKNNRQKHLEQRTCIICGSKFKTRVWNETQTCSVTCSHKLRIKNLEASSINHYRPIPARTDNIAIRAAEANRLGMSYGKYMMYLQMGKNPEDYARS